MIDALPLILFLSIFILILFGFPVAFTLGGVSVLFGLVVFGPDFFYLLALRVYGTMNNYVLLAVPLFIYMGIMLEKSGLAESLAGDDGPAVWEVSGWFSHLGDRGRSHAGSLYRHCRGYGDHHGTH